MGSTEVKSPDRYLITTADERTWKFERPVLFLGEWCRLYDRRHLWQQMDAIVASPYGLGKVQKDADHAEALTLEEKLFPEFCLLLNQQHGMSQNSRFWRILLGHWFRRAIKVLLNRVRTMQQCLENYYVSGVTFYPECSYVLAPSDSYSAIWAFNDDRWNQALNTAILRLLDPDHIQIDILPRDGHIEQIGQFRLSLAASPYSPTQKIKAWCLKRFASASSKLCRDHDAFIINSYLPKMTQLKLQAACGQWPQIWKSPGLVIDELPDLAIRSSLTKSFRSKYAEPLESISRQLLFSLLPICYLEGLASLREAVSQLPWPQHPQFIFTSNSFDTDETFKLWTAQMVSDGVNYYVGQHGNNYGTYRYMDPSVEELTADKFITWGWEKHSDTCEYVPAFILKKSRHKKKTYNPEGGILLIEQPIDHRINTWDSSKEFEKYFEDQQTFVAKINNEPRQKLTIRLHAQARNLNWNEEARWTAWAPALNVESGHVPIDSLIADSRLIVHSYDSTGLLETLSANIPTLAFWQNDCDHLCDSAIPFYQPLINAGIIHFSPTTIANMVNNVWDHVDSWWHQDDVQQARELFCRQYARDSQNISNNLLKLIQGKNK
jgi:putative transferase (TIGR04331 family)